MQRIIVPVLAGVTMALVIYGSALTERAHTPRENAKPDIVSSSPPQGGPNTLQEQHAKAWELLHGSRLRDAQDAFLGILSFSPRDQDALQGLVAVRRKMAGDDPGVLRRQSAEYKEAIRRGVDTPEHYTPPAMEALVAASAQAVQEIEAPNAPISHPLRSPTEAGIAPAGPLPGDKVSPSGKLLTSSTHSVKPTEPQTPLPSGKKLPPSAHPAKPTGPQKADLPTAPAPKVAEKPPVTPAHVTQPSPPASTPKTSPAPPASVPQASPPPPASAPKTPPAPPPSVAQVPPPPPASAPKTPPPPADPSPTIDNRLYMVRVGPVSDRDRASAIAEQLLVGGFSQAKVTSQTGFRVVSEPLPRSAAEGLSATLAGRGIHSQVEPLGGDAAQLLFGAFTSQKDAETLAQRIGAHGYDAWVREGAVYTLQLGPYPQSAVNKIAGIIKSGAPNATVTADPVP